MAKKPLLLPVVVEESEPEECPKCPPVGAPAWMATFADMATLLMAFFVLILSFAELNVPKFKTVAGSLREAFGIQRIVPVVEQPRGTTVLDLSFSPSPSPSVMPQMTQQSTQTESPDLPTDDSGEQGGPEQDSNPQENMEEASEQAEAAPPSALEQALEAAIAQGDLVVEQTSEGVVLRVHAPDLPIDQSAPVSPQPDQPSPADIARDLAALIDANGQGSDQGAGSAARSAAIAEAELRVALRRELGEGLVSVEQKEDRVVITVGAGGAFPSGGADLTAEARDIMARIAFSAMDDASRIEVTGHTDNVPLDPNSPFRDNWGLGAARAASVVREMAASGLIAPDRLMALSKGESQPLTENDTDQGRQSNRRIEIEISYSSDGSGR